MEMYYWIRINLQLAIEKPFLESLEYRTFLKANFKFIGDFKLLCNFIEIALQQGCSPVNLLHYFRTSCSKNTSGWLLLTSLKLNSRTIVFLGFFSNFLRIPIFFFYLGFSFTSIHDSQDSWGRGRGYLFNSSLPLQLASQTLRYQLCGYYRGLTSAQNYQPDSNREPFVSGRKSLATKLRALCSRSTENDQL